MAICEGYATGASIYELANIGVVVAFDAGNLEPVARGWRKLFPDFRFVLCADHDQWTREPINNPGLTRAKEAVAAIGAPACGVKPVFKSLEGRPTDFNDMATRDGRDAVSARILAAIKADIPPPAPPPAPAPAEPQAQQPAPAVAPAAPTPAPVADPPPAHDPSGYFAILGYSEDTGGNGIFHFYQHEAQQPREYSANKLTTEGTQLELANESWWEKKFESEKQGWNKRAAANWLIRACYDRGFFNPRNKVRARGAWLDDDRLVFHFGNRLYVDGVEMGVTKIKSRFIYKLMDELPGPAAEPMTDAEGMHLLEVCRMFKWERPASALLAVGWVALAPVCGALNWRPHIWITGEAHSGKSTFLDDFAFPLINRIGVYAQGSSSEAGVRQELNKDAIPVLFDEGELNNDRDRNRMENVLTMVRQASSQSEAKTLKGTVSGKSLDFHVQSMFCISSIQVAIKQQADRERFARLDILKPGGEGDADRWAVLKDELYKISRDKTIGARLMRRTLNLLPITMKNIETFALAAGRVFGNQRDGDQYGTLLAGAWSITSGKLASYDDAMDMIRRYDWKLHVEETKTDEPSRARTALLGAKIRDSGKDYAISELVSAAAGVPTDSVNLDPKAANAVLKRYGMKVLVRAGQKPADGVLLLQSTSEELPRLLAHTSFASDWKGQLKRGGAERHVGPDGKDKTEWFHGIADRCLALPLVLVLDAGEPESRPQPDDSEPF